MVLGLPSGNCGWRFKSGEVLAYNKWLEYHRCATEQDKLCGALHCQNDAGIVNKSPPTRLANLPVFLYTESVARGTLTCTVALFDVGK